MSDTNSKVYIHEFIDIIGHNRARYMHHMTANWSPMAQAERNQLCYGVWGVVGTTRRWPQVVNMWEEDGFDGLASSFRHEFSHPTLQDPKLAKWWSEAASYRSSGEDRILLPAPWTSTIEQLCAAGVHAEVFAHEQITLPQGSATAYLDDVAQVGQPLYARHGWQLVGAWETAMVNRAEAFVLWAVPTWEQWAALEKDECGAGALRTWRQEGNPKTEGFHRFLMVDAPLCPFRTGRQPHVSDREPGYREH
ncbi:hypothetical protein [Mycobacterium sp. 94-17]|uniref:hypothetical protein n=1 Tax=Mycobacterium sp. 94-17 TaxID=2986147 RepID=UPI002D1F0F1D|nr:hypothetical protein [Mycobacterium sp. 94-17]MEB4209789.1 hypothetical protein [Mycobacterium sp. 94-17]